MSPSWKIKLHPEVPINAPKDNPFAHDLLNFKDSVIRLSDLIEEIETPFTIGIFGDWGSGKTSFMLILREILERKSNFTTFWFNAWEYENENSLMLPLLSKMADDLGKAKFKKVKKIATSVVLTSVNAGLKHLTAGLVEMGDISKNLELYEKEFGKRYERWIGEIDELKKEFKELINKLSKDKSAVIIFIDDLDRCMPENVVRLLENIKHFLSVEGCRCIFIIGVDNEVLKKGIQARYGTNLISGDEYLKKIINISFAVPQAENIDIEAFIKTTAQKMSDPGWFKENAEKVNEFAAIFSQLGITNPREIKPLILRYLIFLSSDESEKYIPDIVIKLIVYRALFPDVYAKKVAERRIEYSPPIIGSNDRSYNPKEFEAIYGSDFAKIQYDRQFVFLRSFANHWHSFAAMFDISDEDIANWLKGTSLGPEPKKQIQEMLVKHCKRTNSDYFKLMDFLFSLS